MTLIRPRRRSVLAFTGTSYTSDNDNQIFGISAGHIVTETGIRVTTAWDGTNDDAAGELGDDGDQNGFITTSEGDLTSTTPAIGEGQYVKNGSPGHLYTSDDTIDFQVTVDTGGDGSEGSADVWIVEYRAYPR